MLLFSTYLQYECHTTVTRNNNMSQDFIFPVSFFEFDFLLLLLLLLLLLHCKCKVTDKC